MQMLNYNLNTTETTKGNHIYFVHHVDVIIIVSFAVEVHCLATQTTCKVEIVYLFIRQII